MTPIVVNPELCRICLTDNDKLINVFENGMVNRNLAYEVSYYYQVKINGDDGRSKMLCKNCIQHIDVWREQLKKATDAQMIIDFLAAKANNSSHNENHQYLTSNIKLDINTCGLETSRSLEQKLLELESKSSTSSRIHKLRNSCPVCMNVNNTNLQYATHNLCSKHSNTVSTCLVPNCYYIFSTIELFIKHYRHHLNLQKQTYLCRKCYAILDCPRSNIKSNHKCQDVSKLLVCCSINFPIMSNFVLHKLQNHSGKMIRSLAQYKQLGLDFNLPSPSKTKFSNEYSKNDLFTCLVSKCDKVFTTKSTNVRHYIQHASIPDEFVTCAKCLHSCLKTQYVNHGMHSSPPIICNVCALNFKTLHDLAEHKLTTHGSLILCQPSQLPGCPVCNVEFERNEDTKAHYLKCFTKNNEEPTKKSVVNTNVQESSPMPRKVLNEKHLSSYKCKICGHSCFKAVEYIEHAKKEHKMYIELKEKGIKLCPLCDQNFMLNKFSAHVEQCTYSMKIGDMPANCFKCKYCNVHFDNVSPSQFRSHVLFCKSFEERTENDIKYKFCINCTFRSQDIESCISHATQFCIYFQLKIHYAMGPDEKIKVENRDENQQVDKINLERKDDISFVNGMLLCKNCSLKFVSYKEAIEHNKNCLRLSLDPIPSLDLTKTTKETNFLCVQCKIKFTDITLYHNHCAKHSAKPNIWQCVICQCMFDNIIELNNHMSNHELQAGVPLAVPIKTETDTTIKTEDMPECVVELDYMDQDVIIEKAIENNIHNNSQDIRVLIDDCNDDDMQYNIEEKPNVSYIMENFHGI
ncbi:uncharacterized protein LOC126839291 [Adelges cooleyi]|uniref:uncharacterized protein LOC126839291 n=1 Tax=Adelges cooleyi TaxID=133065 RepID=UPI00217FF2BB|nr:uncharacterized protein LOC126839291 [Adelges cooleyi]XP_050430476.1 uncharacterized protein LOC126839291 [Adelges cooleyi]